MNADGLRMYIRQMGVSQRELARMLDYNERSIRRYCAGDPIPRVVEYAVRWLSHSWAGSIQFQQPEGGSHGKVEA